MSQTKSKFSWKKSIQDYVSTKDFKAELVNNYSDFKGYEQHDAHEFTTSLLDLMSKELNRVTSKPKYKELKISSKATIKQQASEWAKLFKEREDSHITDNFQGQMMIELKCSKCSNTSYSFDTSMFLHLDLKDSKSKVTTLDELIEGMSAPETIDDYKCGKCKKKANHTKINKLYQAPKILILHLKRFKMGYYSSKKISTDVELDNQLKLPCEDGTTANYSLCCIVHHKGSMESGHYFCEIKDLEYKGSSKWYSFNDEYVKQSPVNATSKTCYVMFYILTN